MKAPRIFYYCYDDNQPTGGEKHSYQHVDILNQHGIEAYAMHRRRGMRLTWFENATRVAYVDEIRPNAATDYVVLPETLGPAIARVRGRKVIFNKNIYSGFSVFGISTDAPQIYLSEDVVAIMAVSPHNAEYLRFAYPGKQIVTVRPDIRLTYFTYRPLSSKRLQIAYATKNSKDGRTLFQILRARSAAGLNRAADAAWIPLHGLSEGEVSAILQDSLLLLFLSLHEGLGRTPLEAMACGCLVCAYDCGPPASYLPRAYQCPYGSLMEMARRIEEVLAQFPDRLHAFDDVTREGRSIAERYSAERQERSVLDAWEQILQRSWRSG